jgi:hypothetical protein
MPAKGSGANRRPRRSGRAPGARRPAVDVRALAERLMRLLKQELRAERERRGRP